MKFKLSCSSKAPDSYSHSHRPPAHTPAAPCTPLHGCVLVHFSGLEILLRNIICGSELLVSLVLVRSTDIRLVMCRVRENVVGSPLPVDHGHMAWRKLVAFAAAQASWGDHLKAGGCKHALLVLGAAC